MAYSLLKRVYTAFNPPSEPKTAEPLKFGILGAARIAPPALIQPAKSHPDVVVYAVAARDINKATKYAKKWGIEKVFGGKGSYQELLDDPQVDVVYNPLPNGLHYEWTMKALQAGKHVLLEKPSSNSAEETRKMFELAEKNGLVLLEAFHYRFHPAIQRLKAILDSGELGTIKSIESMLHIPKGFVGEDDIRYQFELGGGALMDCGCYTVSSTLYLASSTPSEVPTAKALTVPTNPHIDRAMTATLAFPAPKSNITASISGHLSNPNKWGILPKLGEIYVKVECEGGEATLGNFVMPTIYHWIEVKKTGNGGKVERRVEKAYIWPAGQKDAKGEEWWTTYRFQLEAFVDQVRGRKPQTWMTAQESIDNMKTIEMIYAKAGLDPRPASTYVLPAEPDASTVPV
ncbi:NAD(P)-binding protein [Cristinia sonorae]|uniref:D-xylose 1-dehydrogenase (NADP(+), D-xylono-1,5-lactone-forming) n=1 Tax=Cristinia sonorae TaxID=1940300 RepID=A0A8K0XUL5_9AGAR|nr:NAD(P)-binding protein [Cristinia sonorae]